MTNKPDEATVSVEPVKTKTDDLSATLPASTPESLRRLAEDLPEKNAVQKAYKEAMTATDHQKEAKAKLKAAEESPDALDTPSGYGLKESASESNDTKRGEKYLRAKTAKRWGYVPVDES
jgi:hypothetical protein